MAGSRGRWSRAKIDFVTWGEKKVPRLSQDSGRGEKIYKFPGEKTGITGQTLTKRVQQHHRDGTVDVSKAKYVDYKPVKDRKAAQEWERQQHEKHGYPGNQRNGGGGRYCKPEPSPTDGLTTSRMEPTRWLLRAFWRR